MLRKFFFSFCLAFSLLQFAPVPAVAADSTKDIVCRNIPGSDCQDTTDNFLAKALKRVVKPLLYVVGLGAIIMVIVGGIRFVVSSGSQEAVQGAKSTISYALIGLAVTVLAYALVDFVLRKLT